MLASVQATCLLFYLPTTTSYSPLLVGGMKSGCEEAGGESSPGSLLHKWIAL